MWSLSAKRFFDEISEEDFSDDIIKPLPKKRKLADSSNVFTTSKDYGQFDLIHRAINGWEWISSMKIPHISKEIAEYATGMVKECANPACNEKMVVLEQDLIDYVQPPAWRAAHYYANKIGFKWNWKVQNTEFYCLHCMALVKADEICNCAECNRMMGSCREHCSHSKCGKFGRESGVCTICAGSGAYYDCSECASKTRADV